MRKLGILLAMVLAIGTTASTARAGYVDISYSFTGSTVAITMPITFTITGVTGSATYRFSTSNASSHPLASATVKGYGFALNVPVNSLGGALTGTVMQNVTNTVGSAHFNGQTGFPQVFATSVTAMNGQMFSGAFQTHYLTGFLHCFATFHYMNSYNYMTPMGIAVCTMTIGVTTGNISVQYGITGTTAVPLPAIVLGGTGSSLGASFSAVTPVKQQLAGLPPSLGTAYIVGNETGRVHQVPEAGSAVLVGFGLLGLLGISLAGRSTRKK